MGEILDGYEALNVSIHLTCEGADGHDSPPRTYRVTVNRAVPGGIDKKGWETVLETPHYRVAYAQFLVETRRAYRAGEIDYDWIEEREELGGGWTGTEDETLDEEEDGE